MDQSFTDQAAAFLRQAIAEAGGQEVFFLGRTDADLRVVEARVLARGNEQAVPAILQECRYGDVVIHNHPGGRLRPSAADLDIAGRLGAQGVGFLIVDNPVESVYRVVEPFAPRRAQHLEPQAIAAILGPTGVVARTLPGYEERPEQLRMALAVGEALNGDRVTVIEAGTGTGKSLAYLVPAILWALANEERLVVSTNTINLQEQLIRKDLPLSAALHRAQVSGGSGQGPQQLFLSPARRGSAAGAGSVRSRTQRRTRCVAGMGRAQPGRLTRRPAGAAAGEVWEEVQCEVDQCARVRCPHYSACFFTRPGAMPPRPTCWWSTMPCCCRIWPCAGRLTTIRPPPCCHPSIG
jgi:ATP-dependent DNA helicase DinG